MPIEACSKKDSKYDEWEIKDALRTITRADEIKADPKMMKLIAAELTRQQEALAAAQKGIDGLVNMPDKEYKEHLKKIKAI